MVALDTRTPVEAPVRAKRQLLAVVAGVNAVAAWFGGIGLITGVVGFGERLDGRLPFDSPTVAGIALISIVAIPLTALAWAAWAGAARTDDIALLAGVLLIGWILVQVVVLRAFSLFQPTYLGVGVYFVVASHRVRLGPRRRGTLLVAVGSIVAAAGVGLLPHLVENGLTVTSVASVVMVLAGLALVVDGARDALRGSRRRGRAAGIGATLIVIAVVVWLVAPAVAATHVPTTGVTTTPAQIGVEYETVTLTTRDGVELAAWYLPGTRSTGIVMVHGAGSTRSDVLDQAAVLADNGCGIVLIDSRGHGGSGGTAMDFGWYGDSDIAAAVDFLVSRPEIDPEMIGVVGFSMGGEEAVGAAAADPRIGAVIAEGATGRQAADKAWYSDTYGWRGWIQEQFEKVQFGITDFLTETAPPTPLRDAVAAASNTDFLLITAGNVADEGHAAAYVQTAAPDRVAVWNIDDADHTGGQRTQPAQWEQRVVDFLDNSLGGRGFS